MSYWLVAVARAAPVVCDAAAAYRTLDEARIDEARAPVSHPELLPGLALGSENTDPALLAALSELCRPGATLSLSVAERWEAADWSAHTLLLTRAEPDGCALREATVAISVGVRPGGPPRYGLRSTMPPGRTPIGACAEVPRFRDEVVLDGEDGPVRVVLVRDQEGDAVTHAMVVVRVAGPAGWSEGVLLDPAPARLVDGGDGPIVELTDRFEDKWVVAHADRAGRPPACTARPGQTVWRPDAWTPVTGREALGLLAERGLWRLAGQDGWFLIVAQDDEEDVDRLMQRVERLEARSGEDLSVVPSAWFPGLNPGFLIAIPAPWPTEAEARAARERWTPRRQAYVKRAWEVVDACAD